MLKNGEKALDGMKMKPPEQNAGFTLLELAIVILIFGLVTLTVTAALSEYTRYEQRQKTTEAIDRAKGAIIEAKVLTNFYFCPARIDAQIGDPDYGLANCAGSIIAVSGRDADGLADPVTGDNNDNVLIGMIPFKTLEKVGLASGITGKDTLDGWGNRMTYMVSEFLAYDIDEPAAGIVGSAPNSAGPAGINKGEFDEDLGVIDVIDEFGATTLEDPYTAQFAIISHGENGWGAYSETGELVSACTTSITDPLTGDPVPTSTLVADPDESENCDHNDGRAMAALRSTASGRYYDDRISVTNVNSYTLWKTVEPEPVAPGVFLDRIIPTAPGRIGVGTNEPSEKLHVIGDVEVDNIIADSYCNKTGSDCMSAESIAGDDPDMQCSGNNKALRTIKQNKFTCVTLFSGPVTNQCPNGYVACGLSNMTGILCRDKNDPTGPCEAP